LLPELELCKKQGLKSVPDPEHFFKSPNYSVQMFFSTNILFVRNWILQNAIGTKICGMNPDPMGNPEVKIRLQYTLFFQKSITF
jgi:hypothetical protein